MAASLRFLLSSHLTTACFLGSSLKVPVCCTSCLTVGAATEFDTWVLFAFRCDLLYKLSSNKVSGTCFLFRTAVFRALRFTNSSSFRLILSISCYDSLVPRNSSSVSSNSSVGLDYLFTYDAFDQMPCCCKSRWRSSTIGACVPALVFRDLSFRSVNHGIWLRDWLPLGRTLETLPLTPGFAGAGNIAMASY